MNAMDEALDQMAALINAANDATLNVEELKQQLSAWHKRWIDGPELSNVMKIGLLAAFSATFRAVAQGRTETQLHRDLDQIARDGGSRPERRP